MSPPPGGAEQEPLGKIPITGLNGKSAPGATRRGRPRWLFWAAGVLVVLILMGFAAMKGLQRLMKPPAKTERTEVVQRGVVEIKVVETGQIEAIHKVEVKSKVSGRVARLFVDEGQVVREGQVLANIDPQEINSQVLALRAQLAGAQARLAATRQGANYQQLQTSSSIDQARHSVDAARAKLQEVETETAVQPELKTQSVNVAVANLEAAKAALRGHQAALRLLVESTHPQAVVSAKSASEQAAAQANNDRQIAQRQRQLANMGYAARQDADAAETQAAVSAAHAAEMKDRVDRIEQTNATEEADAVTQVAAAEQQVHQMEAQLRQARMSVLPETSVRQLEGARASLAQAEAQLAAARSGRSQDQVRRDDSRAAESEVAQVTNQLNEKLVSQRDTTLYAPMAGVVTRRYVEPGELITSAVSSFASSAPLFQIADLSTVVVKIDVNEVDVAKIRRGALAEVTVDGLGGITLTGRVRKVSPSATTGAADASGAPTNQGKILFRVEVQIDSGHPGLRPGMSARCAIIVERKSNVLRVPPNCVEGAGAEGTVQVVTSVPAADEAAASAKEPVDLTTAARKVKIGLRGDEYVEILSGLREGERVKPTPYQGPERKTVEMRPD